MCRRFFQCFLYPMHGKFTDESNPAFYHRFINRNCCCSILWILNRNSGTSFRGDYLAIVTLAFGEIIKNVINVLYVGKDENGLHFAINDSKSLNMSGTGEMIIDGAKESPEHQDSLLS